jgi:outer membrane protein
MAQIMNKILPATFVATFVLGMPAFGLVAQAQELVSTDSSLIPGTGAPVGKQAGTLMVRIRAIGVLPENTSSSVSAIGGGVNVTSAAAPEVDLSYFFTDHIAVEGIAASTRHSVSAGHISIGHVDVGSVYVLPPTVTLQYHFTPHERFSPYVGAGMTVAFFYDGHSAGPPVDSFGLDNNVGAAIQAGVDYNFNGHWFANFDVKQIFLNTTARINGGAIVAKTSLDPTLVGAGIGYRF